MSKQLKMKTGRTVDLPTDEEDKAIQAGIAADPDNPEWTDADFSRAKPLRDVVGDSLADQLIQLRKPGRPLADVTKVPVTMRLDPDLVEAMRETGAGWQGRANDALRSAFLKRKKASA